jgi:predicted dehydrogenase
MNGMEKLGIGVSGLGVGERHARMVAGLSEPGFLGLYDPNREKAAGLAKALGAVAVGSFQDLIDDERVKVIVVASPDHDHVEQIVAALRSGRHVFTEKPMCNTARELERIVREWRGQSDRLWLRSNLVLRAAPLYQWLRKEIAQGTFGEVYAFDGEYLYGRLEKITGGWRGTGDNYSGIKGGGVHLIDLMCWITGQKPVSVHTAGNGICTRGSSVAIKDYASCTFRFDSGLVGRVTANLGCVHRHHHVMRVYGTEATFIYDDCGPRIHRSRDPMLRATPVELDPLPAGKSELLPVFLDAIRDGIDMREQTEEEFSIMSMCFAGDASLASGAEERIAYP